MKDHTKKNILAIGDGGNDVGMIQVADVGVGIVGMFWFIKVNKASRLLWLQITQYRNSSIWLN